MADNKTTREWPVQRTADQTSADGILQKVMDRSLQCAVLAFGFAKNMVVGLLLQPRWRFRFRSPGWPRLISRGYNGGGYAGVFP